MTKAKVIRTLGFAAFLAPVILFGVGVPPHAERSYALSSLANGALAPDFTAAGSDGARHHLSDHRGSTVVLEWTSPICEFTAQQYDSGNMQALQAYAAEHKVVWLSIDTAAPGKPGYLTEAAAVNLTKARGATITSFLFDPTGEIGQRYGAKSTPSIYVIDPSGTLVYQGAVNEQTRGDPRKVQNYVRPALDDVLSGKPVSLASTRQYGCPVEY
jgi:peroxiredoxin